MLPSAERGHSDRLHRGPVVCAQGSTGYRFCRVQRCPCLGRKTVTAPTPAQQEQHIVGCRLDPESDDQGCSRTCSKLPLRAVRTHMGGILSSATGARERISRGLFQPKRFCDHREPVLTGLVSELQGERVPYCLLHQLQIHQHSVNQTTKESIVGIALLGLASGHRHQSG